MAKGAKIQFSVSLFFFFNPWVRKILYLFSANIVLTIAIISAFSIFSPCLTSAATCEQWIAEAVSMEGIVEIRRAGTNQWQPVHANDRYCPGDTITVREQSRADVALVNQPLIRLDQNALRDF